MVDSEAENPKYGYSPEDALVSYLHLCRRLKNVSNTTLIVFPSGHRSEEKYGALQQGEIGISHLARQLAPVLCLPVGIVYKESFDRNGINLGKEVNLRLALPIFYQTITKEEAKSDVFSTLMLQLASVLPVHMRGAWARGYERSGIVLSMTNR